MLRPDRAPYVSDRELLNNPIFIYLLFMYYLAAWLEIILRSHYPFFFNSYAFIYLFLFFILFFSIFNKNG